jgi:hypothetical protein
MRLSVIEEKMARDELTGILKAKSGLKRWVPTSDLIGTPRFHGTRTLTSAQVHRILKKDPNVVHQYVDSVPPRIVSLWAWRS